jgi:hypothetical protein
VEDSEKAPATDAESSDDPKQIASPENRTNAPDEETISGSHKNKAKQFVRRLIVLPGAVVRWLDSHDGLITAAATIAIAVLTYYLAIYANGQEKILHQQIADARATQRAFVYVKGWQTECHAIGKEIICLVGPEWENSGNTPTQTMDIELSCHHGPPDAPDPTLLPAPNATRAHRLLGPKQTTAGGACKLGEGDIRDARKGAYEFYMFARATYTDVFDRSYGHVTEYCAEFTDYIWEPKTRDLSLFSRPCATHNCADEQCKG